MTYDPDLTIAAGYTNETLTKDAHPDVHNDEIAQINGFRAALGDPVLLLGDDPDLATRVDRIDNAVGDSPGGSLSQTAAHAPVAGSAKLIPPAGLIANSVSSRTLTSSDRNKIYFVKHVLPAGTVVPGLPHNIVTGAGGGGSTTAVLTGDSSTFEAGVGNWTAVTNAQALASVTTWAHGGTHSLRMRATAIGKVKVAYGGAGGALNNRPTCAPGDTFTCAGYLRAAVTGRPFRWYIDYFDSSHAYKGTVSGATTVSDLTSGTGTLLSQIFTVPTTAPNGGTPASARIGIENTSTATAASEDHYLDDATIAKNAGSGGASGAVFRLAMWQLDDHGEMFTTPLAVTGPVDATIAGDAPNLFPAGPYIATEDIEVVVGRDYQYTSTPSPHPTIWECDVVRYVPTVDGLDSTAGTKMGWSQSGVSGSLAAVVGAPDAETDNIPFIPLGTVSATGGGGGGGGGTGTGQVMFGMSKGIGPTNTGGGNIATATTILENIAKAANGGTNVHFSCTRMYHNGLSSSAGFPSAEETAYHNSTNNGFSARTIFVSISVQGQTSGVYQTPWSAIGAGTHDAKIQAWATKLLAEATRIGRPVWVCLQHEPNAHTQSGQTPADYVAASQRFYTVLKAITGDSVLVYWIPTADGFKTGTKNPAVPFYPGDAYVDSLGVDGYNPSIVWHNSGKWIEFKDVFKEFLLFADQHTAVPRIVVAEVGSANDTTTPNLTRRAQWVDNALAEIKTNPQWSRLAALIYWDNHDNATASGGGYAFPGADWTWENLTTTSFSSPNTTADTPTTAAIVRMATDAVML